MPHSSLFGSLCRYTRNADALHPECGASVDGRRCKKNTYVRWYRRDLTTASISARKFWNGTMALSATSESRLAPINSRHLSRPQNPSCPTPNGARQSHYSGCPGLMAYTEGQILSAPVRITSPGVARSQAIEQPTRPYPTVPHNNTITT